jgi:opacity protein-like surface antigen
MKRFAATLCALGVLLAAGPAPAQIGVRVTGGLSYVSYGDFNDFAEYINNEVLAASGISGEIGSIHWIPEFAVEAVLPITPLVDLGIGGGGIRGASDFSFDVGSDRFDYEHTVKAYPMTATAYVKLPMLPFARPYASAGAGVYYAKVTFEETVTSDASVDGFTASLTKWGFGLHGGAGLAFSIAPRVILDLGLRGRWVKIKGFEGTATSLDGESIDTFLAYYTDEDGAPQFGPEAAADRGTYGEGTVDLSGFAFTLSLLVAF